MGRRDLSIQRRKEIIIAFYEVAKQIGLENTSIDKVAGQMNVSKGLVLHYFKNREELLIGLNEYILEQHLRVMSPQSRTLIKSEDQLNNYIEQLFSRKWNSYFDDGVFYSCYAMVYRNRTFKISFKAYLEELHKALFLILSEAQQHKVINIKNIAETTEIIFALVDGAYYYLGMFEESEDLYNQKITLFLNHTKKILGLV